MASTNPQNVTLYGRLSYPVFNHKDAVARNAKSAFPKTDPNEVSPEFNILLDQVQLDKFMAHVTDVFLPYCLAQHTAGEKRNALDAAQIKRIMGVLEDPENQPPYIPLKLVPEKTQDLAPDAVYMLKVTGNKGVDIELKAIVNAEEELAVPDPTQLTFPVIKPLRQTVHNIYAGCYVAITANLYAFVSGKVPGFSASSSVCIFKMDGDRFGGGGEIDEDEIFAD